MCNNSPAKATSSENEWRSRVQHTPSGFRYVDVCGDTSLVFDKAETQSCRGIPRCTTLLMGRGRHRRLSG